MNSGVRVWYNNLNRKLTNRLLVERLYLWWFFFAFVVFIVLGALPMSFFIQKKIVLISEMKEVNSSLAKKADQFASLKTSIAEVQPYISYLDKYTSKDINTQNYLIDFQLAASLSGYKVLRFVPVSDSSLEEVEIGIFLEGYGGIDNLIQSIETLKRVTNIKEISLTRKDDVQNVSMVITIYNVN